ncbi:MAG: DegT/DnrJ/EryC1/StrS aminotransferase family protein [Alphaproteobacteria bacterium]|jgi:dTDP-4-amino-4,6-dideoxygalactose transaminase|nr:DegT/DnrJ/EryC1/StrS aminotransferase family protein [Alphaproteobacteria bacterium]
MSQTIKKELTEFLPFSRPTISEEAIADVVETLRSGWITTGPRVAKFEDALRAYLQTPHALTLTSATTGLYLALEALEFDKGDEVITTPMTFAGTLNVIALNGLKPVLVDVEPGTYNMDVSQIASKITPRTKAIMPVHFGGCPVDLDPLYELAAKHNLRVIEDAAHAIGTEYKARRIGSFGDMQVFSFHPNKNMTTGEGGCISLRDDELAKKLTLLRFHGMDREAWNRFGKSGSQHYEIIAPGHKANMMDLQAAVGIHQLASLDTFIDQRKALVERYQDGLKDCPGLTLPSSPSYPHRHAWHLFAPLVNNFDRDEVMSRLKERNIGTGLHYHAVHLYPFYRETYGWKEGDFPIAESIGNRIFSLPLFPTLTHTQQDQVIAVLREILG